MTTMILSSVLCSIQAFAEEKDKSEVDEAALLNLNSATDIKPTKDANPNNSAQDNDREFYQALTDILSDFKADITSHKVIGVVDISVRYIEVNESVPPSFRNHLELLVIQAMQESKDKINIIKCDACRAKMLTLEKNQVLLQTKNADQMLQAKVAEQNGVKYFLDGMFSLESASITLSLSILEAASGKIVWTNTYSSESSSAGAFRRGVDYKQSQQSRLSMEYIPIIQTRFGLSYLYTPDLQGLTNMLGFFLRVVERYNNRKFEVGFELDYYIYPKSLLSTVDPTQSLYNALSLNVTILFLHAFNFIGAEESYHIPRFSMNVGIGGSYASGYLSLLARVGAEYRLGRRFVFGGFAGYKPNATVFISGQNTLMIGGFEGGVQVGALF